MKRALTVLAREEGSSLGHFVEDRLGLSTQQSLARIGGGAVYLDGRRERDPARLLRAGARVLVFEPQPDGGLEVELAHAESDLAVVVKPAGLPSIASRRGGDSVAAWIEARFGHQARLLHRLDQEASGLLLVSRRLETREHFARQVREHRLARRYHAVVQPEPPNDALVIDRPLIRRGLTSVVGQGPGAKRARTRAWTRQRGDGRALLEVELETGRLHQIRAHLAWAGYPLLGDRHHGGAPFFRLALHASFLRVERPDGSRLELASPLPQGFWPPADRA